MPPPADSLDLFSWPALQAARTACAQAEARRAAAARRYQYAPHGERERRLRLLQEATRAALIARSELAAAEQEARS